MITRFDPVSVCSEADMREHANGDYVSYEDHAAALAAKDAEIERLREALEECEEYFDGKSDADYDETGFVPNKEMQMLVAVRAAINPGSAK